MKKILFIFMVTILTGNCYSQEQGITLEAKPSDKAPSTLSFSDGQTAKVSQQDIANQKTDSIPVNKEKPSKNIEKQIKANDKINDKNFEKAVTKDQQQEVSKSELPPKNMPVEITPQERVDGEYIRILVKSFADKVNSNNYEDINNVMREHVSFVDANLNLDVGSSKVNREIFYQSMKDASNIILEENSIIEIGEGKSWAVAYLPGKVTNGSKSSPIKLMLVLSKIDNEWKIYSFSISEISNSVTTNNSNMYYVFLLLGFALGGLSSAVLFRRKLKKIM